MMTRTSNKKSKLFLISGLGAFLFCGIIFAQSLQGINDTSETLFEANFASSGDLTHDVNKIYAKNLGNVITVYMNPKLITQKYNNNYTFTEINNTIQTSPILGGKNIDVYSKNVTIIGGTNITVNEENNNASILGGQGNTLQKGENTDATPAILIGGNENTIGEEQEGNAIIGGQDNKIEDNTQHTQILGGKGNIISANDVIVAGNKINNTTAGKSFVFSSNEGSEKFIPNSSNSFYLNIENGFGINKSTQGKGVETQGAINVGNIDITSTNCTSENIGLFGYFEQCLVGCTTGSANNEGKRNLMDAHTGCVEMCNTNSGHCIAPDPVIIPTTGSQCIGSIPNSENYKRCNQEDKDNITLNTLDVQFSSQFVDVCPKPLNISANPCLYTCKSDATRIDGEGCQKNCTGVNGVTLKHGETITAYKHTSETCTNQCKDNQALLKCNNGNLINQKNGESTTDYKHTSCTTTGNDLPCEGFNLTKEQKDQHLTGHNYLTCTGYTVDGPNCAPYNKYKLNPDTPCQNGWTYQPDLGYCTKNCTRNGSGYTRGQHVSGWNAAEVTCTSTSSTCTSKQLTCQEDGSWGADETTYPYTQCNLIGETCEQHKLDSCPAHGHCSECFSYTANSPSQCLSGSIHYRLDRCDDGFTLVNNKCEPECELPRGEKIKYGETRIAFSKTDAECAETCNQNSEKFTCKEGGNLIGQNGGTTGTYRYKECVVHDVICEPNFDLTGTFSHGKFDTCIGYTTDGTSCTEFRAYDLTGCNDYYTYTGDTCKAKCRLPWDNTSQTSTLVDHGTKTGAYLALDETCGNKCTSVYTGIICNEGKRYYQANPTQEANTGANGYRFKSCEQKVPNCTIYTKSNSNIYITFSGLSQPIIPHATGAMAPCLNYTYQVGTDICQYNFTNYTFKCDLSTDSNSDYARNPAGTACTRCEKPATWNSHTVRNNGTPQPDNVMVGIYNPNSTAACTYQCDEHSKRDGEKCAADCGLTNSSGKDQRYKDGETVIGYTAPSYRCSSASVKCESAQLICKNGSWTLKSNGQYTTDYTYNYSKTISQTVTKTNNDTQKTLTYIDANRGEVVDLGTEYFTDNNCACTAGEHRYKQTCKSGYTWAKNSDGDWHCYADCTINWSDAESETLEHGESRTAYDTDSVDCPDNCSSETRTCNDGTISGTYTYKGPCTRNGIIHNDYNIRDVCPSNCNCDGPVTDYTDQTCIASTRHKLTGAKPGYHQEGNSCVANSCASKPDNSTWWNSNLPSSDGADAVHSDTDTSTACTFYCDSDYYRYNGKCEPKPVCNSDGGCSVGTATADEGNYYSTYLCKKSGASDVSCNCPIKNGKQYVWEDTECVEARSLCDMDNGHFHCLLDATVSNTGYSSDGTQWTWDCDIGSLHDSCSENIPPEDPDPEPDPEPDLPGPVPQECYPASSPLSCPSGFDYIIMDEDTNSVTWECDYTVLNSEGICICTEDILDRYGHIVDQGYTQSQCEEHSEDYGCFWDEDNEALETEENPCYTYECTDGEWNSSRNRCEYECNGQYPGNAEKHGYDITTSSNTSWHEGNGTDACTFKCKDGETYNSTLKICVASCSNYMEQQNCEAGQGGSARGTRDESTCSCNCPTGTTVSQDNHCERDNTDDCAPDEIKVSIGSVQSYQDPYGDWNCSCGWYNCCCGGGTYAMGEQLRF